jgi:hypothetical protein
VLERYIDSTLADQSHYEMGDARRYLSWIARFLNEAEVSPFGLKSTDNTVFDLAELTPPEPPRGYRLFAWVIWGLVLGLSIEVILVLFGGRADDVPLGVLTLLGLTTGLLWETGAALLSRWTSKRSALSSRLTFVWPSTKQRRHDFLRRAGQGWFTALFLGLAVGFLSWYGGYFISKYASRPAPVVGLRVVGLSIAVGLTVGLVFVLVRGLVDTRPVLIVNSTPKEASSRSMITALLYVLIAALLPSLLAGVLTVLSFLWLDDPKLALLVATMGLVPLMFAPPVGLVVGIVWGLNNGGWFVVLQKIAHRRLARAGDLPSPPYDFLEWGIERQIFRRIGGGVRFRHNLIQQHRASTSAGGS